MTENSVKLFAHIKSLLNKNETARAFEQWVREHNCSVSGLENQINLAWSNHQRFGTSKLISCQVSQVLCNYKKSNLIKTVSFCEFQTKNTQDLLKWAFYFGTKASLFKMTSGPKSLTQATETDSAIESPEREQIKLSRVEPTAEPQPEWSVAIHSWGAAWDFHQYGLGACFGLVGLVALVTLVKLLKFNRAARQKRVPLVVLSQIISFGFTRCVFLCLDAYNSKQYLPFAVLNIIRGIAQPCLIAAFMLIFLILRNALVMKTRFQNWYTSRNIALITIPYFLFVFSSETIVSFFPTHKGLLIVCQIIGATLYLSLAVFYCYIAVLIRKKMHLMQQRTRETTIRGRQSFSIFKRCIAVALSCFSIGVMHVYAMASIHRVFSATKYVDAWLWFAFHTSMRCLEIGMSVLLYVIGTQNNAVVSRVRLDAAPMKHPPVDARVAWNSTPKDTEHRKTNRHFLRGFNFITAH